MRKMDLMLIQMGTVESRFDWWIFRIAISAKLSQNSAQINDQSVRVSNQAH
jgi:hypothetical protein